MDHTIYTGMMGVTQSFHQQEVMAHNLANTETTGFRGQLTALRAVPVEGLSLPTRTLVTASTPGADMTPGAIQYTARPLDVAVQQQDGWLVVKTADGQEAYTRNGHLQIDPTGQLVIQGNLVMGENGSIALPQNAQVTIAGDGTITALKAGGRSNATVQLARLKRVKAKGNELVRGDDGLFRLNQQARNQRGAVLPADDMMKVTPGALEKSNVNPITVMQQYIRTSWAINMNTTMVKKVYEKEKCGNQILSIT